MLHQIKPLFVPLKTQYYEEFVSGNKDTEYRKYGRGWNEKTCRIGREVVISNGYGKYRRSRGIIRSFKIVDSSTIPSAREVYGYAKLKLAAIGIDLIDIDFTIE